MNSISILTSDSEILSVLRKNLPPFAKDFLCFYSSQLNAFITDPVFMTIPLEDKIVHRGYAVFETSKINGNKIYQLDKHLARFQKSIASINLQCMYSQDELKDILLKLAGIARKVDPTCDVELRYFYSAGLGTMSPIVKENMNTFYAIAIRTDYSLRPVDGVDEILVRLGDLRKNISKSKNTNYLLNALVTKESRERGGYLGVMVDEEGNILECPTSNIAFVLLNGDFCVPSFEKTLVGTTIVRCMDYIEKELIPKGYIKSISREYLKEDSFLEKISEMMLVGGDFVIPILKINGRVVSAEPGPIARMIQQFLLNDKNGEEAIEEIPEIILEEMK